MPRKIPLSLAFPIAPHPLIWASNRDVVKAWREYHSAVDSSAETVRVAVLA